MRPTYGEARRALAVRLALMRLDVGLLTADVVVVVAAFCAALVVHEGLAPSAGMLPRVVRLTALAVVVYLVLNASLGVYGGVWRQAGAVEARRLAAAGAAAGCVLVVTTLVSWGTAMLGLTVDAVVFAFVLLAAVRFRSRLLPTTGEGAASPRVVVVGSVEIARSLVAQTARSEARGFVPVAVVCTTSREWGRTLGGVPVTGPLDVLPQVVAQSGADEVLLAFPADAGPEVNVAVVAARTLGTPLKILTTTDARLSERDLDAVRDVSVEDLLGREQVDVDVAAVRGVVTGRRVLVTGAGGSIGSEIAAQVSRLAPAQLVLLDQDETHLHDAQALLSGPATSVLGDIRDEVFVDRLFATARPEVVFHAAAYKHVPILEDFPVEAVRTNVLGTDILLAAAAAHGTERFVAISTDKAVNPANVMGATKRLAEQLVVHRRPPGSRYCAVRFGNVLGSRGSVVPTFLRQVREGGPVTVTHPDVTRFFMTTREAVELVLEAATMTQGGEIFVLDMGQPVRIVDLAERIISLSGRVPGEDVRIEFTGLRPGEKLVEELQADGELCDPTAHPKIRRLRAALRAADGLLSGLAELRDSAERRDELRTRLVLLALAADRRQLLPAPAEAAALEVVLPEAEADEAAAAVP